MRVQYYVNATFKQMSAQCWQIMRPSAWTRAARLCFSLTLSHALSFLTENCCTGYPYPSVLTFAHFLVCQIFLHFLSLYCMGSRPYGADRRTKKQTGNTG